MCVWFVGLRGGGTENEKRTKGMGVGVGVRVDPELPQSYLEYTPQTYRRSHDIATAARPYHVLLPHSDPPPPTTTSPQPPTPVSELVTAKLVCVITCGAAAEDSMHLPESEGTCVII